MALLPTEYHVGQHANDEPKLPLSADGVLRVVWNSRFGDMLIEVRDGKSFVNRSPVEAAAPTSE